MKKKDYNIFYNPHPDIAKTEDDTDTNTSTLKIRFFLLALTANRQCSRKLQ